MKEDQPSRDVHLDEPVDLVKAFDQSHLEFLEVTDIRAIVLLDGAIYLIDMEDGTLREPTVLTVELWEPPPGNPSGDEDELLDRFTNQLERIL